MSSQQINRFNISELTVKSMFENANLKPSEPFSGAGGQF